MRNNRLRFEISQESVYETLGLMLIMDFIKSLDKVGFFEYNTSEELNIVVEQFIDFITNVEIFKNYKKNV